jgi:hypothetical protein
MIFAIDPGNEESAFVLYGPSSRTIANKGTVPNAAMLQIVTSVAKDPLAVCAIEMIASYGMAVGAEIFETVYWIGRFAERWSAVAGVDAARVFRRAVKLHLCGTSTAKDANVRQALIDMFGPGKGRAIGKKATPGPLFGVSGDQWSALAVAVTFAAGRPDLCGRT